RFRTAVYVVTVFVLLWSITFLLPAIVPCVPLQDYWAIPVRPADAKCIPAKAMENMQFAYGSLNFLSDIIIYCLPIPTIWRLRMPKMQKWSLTGLFAL